MGRQEEIVFESEVVQVRNQRKTGNAGARIEQGRRCDQDNEGGFATTVQPRIVSSAAAVAIVSSRGECARCRMHRLFSATWSVASLAFPVSTSLAACLRLPATGSRSEIMNLKSQWQEQRRKEPVGDLKSSDSASMPHFSLSLYLSLFTQCFIYLSFSVKSSAILLDALPHLPLRPIDVVGAALLAFHSIAAVALAILVAIVRFSTPTFGQQRFIG